MKKLTFTLLFASVLIQGFSQNDPQLPQVYLNTCMPTTTITKTVCSSGCDYNNTQLQQAIDDAVYGTEIVLEAGVIYSGNFTLPVKQGTGWIVIRTSDMNGITQPDYRVKPQHASSMPKIFSPNSTAAIVAPSKSHNYRLVGIEISVTASALGDAITSGATNYSLSTFGEGSETVKADQAHDFIIDRCYIHGDPTKNVRRGVYFCSASSAVIDSYISDCHEIGADAQAVLIGNSPGPIKLVNNHLEGSGENVMFGGVDVPINNLIPEDVEIKGNYFYKPLTWKIGHASYAGYAWSIKNSFELKYVRRCLIDGNIFENNWSHAQDGTAINMKAANQDGGMPWAVTEHVTFSNNIVRHSGSAFVSNGRDQYNGPTMLLNHMKIYNNLFDDINSTTWGGGGRFTLVVSGPDYIIYDHNTCLQDGNTITVDVPQVPNFVFTNNLTPQNLYGIKGSGSSSGNGTITDYFPNSTFLKNVLIGSSNANPANNFYPATINDVGFVNYNNGNGGDYHLTSNSLYKNAGTDGKDVGADIDAVNAATAGVISGYFASCGVNTAMNNSNTPSQPLLAIYPNPSTEAALLQIAVGIDLKTTSILINDIQGKNILAFQSPTERRIILPNERIKPGVYFICLSQTTGITQTIKWIKQ